MKDNQYLELQAFLDGELSQKEAAQIEQWITKDPEAQALFTELQITKTIVAANELEAKVPESREFYWSKIEREIARVERPQSERGGVSILSGLRRFFAPFSVVAAAVALVLMVTKQSASSHIVSETTTADNMAALTYRSNSEKITVVWLYARETDDSSANLQ